MTIKFPDLSHYQTGVDVTKYPALMTKATEGVSFVDPTYAGYKTAAAKAGIPFCAYHFLAVGNIPAQAAHAYSVIGATPTMLDVETGTTGAPSLADVFAFIDAYRALGGVLSLAYIPHWYWLNKWHSPSLDGLAARGVGLIASQYTTYSDSGPGWAAYGGVTPVIWQYTSTPLDMNAYLGTQADLDNLFAHGMTQGDLVTTPAEFLALLNDPSVIAYMRGVVWQYDGRGIAATSTLAALDGAYHAARASDVAALAAKVDVLATAVGQLPTSAAPAAPIDLDALSSAVADKLAARLQS